MAEITRNIEPIQEGVEIPDQRVDIWDVTGEEPYRDGFVMERSKASRVYPMSSPYDEPMVFGRDHAYRLVLPPQEEGGEPVEIFDIRIGHSVRHGGPPLPSPGAIAIPEATEMQARNWIARAMRQKEEFEQLPEEDQEAAREELEERIREKGMWYARTARPIRYGFTYYEAHLLQVRLRRIYEARSTTS